MITEAPPLLTEVMCSSPGICPNCRSKGAVMAEVVTSGLAPGYVVVTTMMGWSTWGSDAIGNKR